MTSPEVQRLARLEEKVGNIDEKVDKLDAKLDKLIDGMDNRYASKLTERIVYGLVSLVLLAAATALIAPHIH